jgi:predicted AlkP superfamily pyrophosphatase or phosphodiesterase
MHLRTTPLFLILALLFCGCDRSASSPSKAPRVLIISVDGFRPDLLLSNNTPNMRLMMKNGSYTMWARTTEISITLPSHTSMLTGVTPERHDIWWNADIPKSKERSPAVPTIFELAHKRGYTTAMVTGKSKFDTLIANEPSCMDWSYLPDGNFQGMNIPVAKEAAKIIHAHHPQVMFIHLPDVDGTGHASGWGSAAQRQAVDTADQAVGIIFNALRQEGLLESTTVILSADHGGSGGTHGKEDFRSRYIPWIIVGPNVKPNQDLTTIRDLIVNTEDTFATAAWVLGIPLDEDLDGKPITQAFNEPKPRELITSAKK